MDEIFRRDLLEAINSTLRREILERLAKLEDVDLKQPSSAMIMTRHR